MLFAPIGLGVVNAAGDSGIRHSEMELSTLQGPLAEMKIPVAEDEAVVNGSPSSNLHANTNRGGLFVGHAASDGWARSWLKFNLGYLPENIGIVSASFHVYLNDEWNDTADAPIGLYYSTNDTWDETTITWENQPDFEGSTLGTISPPYNVSIQNWYEWQITDLVTETVENDKILSVVLKLEDEETSFEETWEYFTEKDYDQFNASYLAVEYTIPEAGGLQVDGFDASPHIDYIQDSEPDLSWSFLDTGTGETQMDYEVEVWDNEYFNDTLLFSDSRGTVHTVHDSGVTSNARPFETADEFRFQLKYPTSMLPRSGIIDKLYFEVEDETGTAILENLQITMVSTTIAGSLAADYAGNFAGSTPIQVMNRESYEAEIIDNWLVIDVENSFFSSMNKNLIIELRFTNNTGTLSRALHSTSVGGSVAYDWGDGAYFSTAAVYLYDRTHNMKIEYASEVTYETGVTSTNAYPFNTDLDEAGIFQLMYNESLIPDTGIIDRLYIGVAQSSGRAVFENLTIRLVETPHEGTLNYTDFELNYGGVTPTIVLEEERYSVFNVGGAMVIDFDDVFEYTGEYNLLFEMRWDALLEGGINTYRALGAGAYRAWNVTWGGNFAGSDTNTYDFHLQFVEDDTQVTYDGTALVNDTTYYWRVRVMDTMGVWSEWATQSFTYAVITSVPEWSNLTFDPDPGVVGTEETVSITVTHLLGIEDVWFEFDGSNHSMSGVGDSYSYSWTPTEAGNFTYSVYMESTIGTWASTSGVLTIVNPSLIPGLPIDTTTLLIIVVGALALIIIILVVRKKK
jgi:hypothetical protein